MPVTRDNVVVPAAGAGYADVVATIPARMVDFLEDPNNGGGVGIHYKEPRDGFVAIKTLKAGETLTIGNAVAQGNGAGPIVGMPAQTNPTVAATVLLKIESVGAQTKYRITETE